MMIEKLNISDSQEDLQNLIKSVTEDNKIYELQSHDDSAILISQKSYKSLQETIELLSIPRLDETQQLVYIHRAKTY
ncbi:MAG: prevent-host-death protein [Crocosphaera sp.]|nr:prevent-host-death protein [Crocosphaera sp.]